jgi:RNA-dependent RNA polymerase
MTFCTNSRVRDQQMAKMRQVTLDLANRTRRELVGSHGDDLVSLLASWVAWEVAVSLGNAFGAQSFGWIALSAVLEVLKALGSEL